jgi:Uma2 family endonuclease
MAVFAQQAFSRMSVAEFLDWPGDGSGRAFQLVDGEPHAMAPASITHGRIQATLVILLGNHLAGADARCDVVTAPGIIPRIRSSSNMRVPDLAVNCTPDEPGQRALPDPILIIEILSPSNEAETRANVWAYASIPSVREILLIRSTHIGAELFRRQDDGDWPDAPNMLQADDVLTLASVDLSLPLRSCYSATHLGRTA